MSDDTPDDGDSGSESPERPSLEGQPIMNSEDSDQPVSDETTADDE